MRPPRITFSRPHCRATDSCAELIQHFQYLQSSEYTSEFHLDSDFFQAYYRLKTDDEQRSVLKAMQNTRLSTLHLGGMEMDSIWKALADTEINELRLGPSGRGFLQR